MEYDVIDGTIIMNIEDYDSEEEFWNAVGEQTKLLTRSNYVAIVRYEDCDIYAIDYIYNPWKENTYRDMINTYNDYKNEEFGNNGREED